LAAQIVGAMGFAALEKGGLSLALGAKPSNSRAYGREYL
jgi:hypothetical protein